MKPIYYIWIALMAMLSGLLLACDPEPDPDPEPPRYEMPDPYFFPMTTDSIGPYNKLKGRWVLCGLSTQAELKPECRTPLFPHKYDTLVFTDSLYYNLRIGIEYARYYSYTDSTFHYGKRPDQLNYSHTIEFRNRDRELLIRSWDIPIEGPLDMWSHYEWACFHNIDRAGW